MTRKDYIVIAAALKSARLDSAGNPVYCRGYTDGLDTVAQLIADVLAKDNPRFDLERFYEAAGYES